MTAETRQRLKYLLADYISTNIALIAFNIFRYYELPSAFTAFYSLGNFLSSPMLVTGQVIFPPFMMLLYYMSGIYSLTSVRSRVFELTTTAATTFIGTIIFLFAILINDLTLDRTRDYSLFIMLFAMTFLIVYIPRLIITWRANARMMRGETGLPTLIVGYSSVPQLFPRQLENISPTVGVRAVGLVDYENRSRFCTSGTDLPISDIDGIKDTCQASNIRRIIVIPHPGGWDKTLDVIGRLFDLDIPVFIAAESLPAYMFNTRMLSLTAEPFIDITGSHLSPSTLCTKRMFDVVISAIMLTVCAVPLAIMAAAVKIDSKGPAFYRQERMGLRKKRFQIIKLRTMRLGSEADGAPTLSHKNDSRVTGLGRFLRKYRIDELPQFFNVLRGDMSIVGPRPERPYFVEKIMERDPSYTLLHRIRPGITSLGMIRYGYATTVDEMIARMRYDLFYLDKISLLTDLRIIVHTIYTVMSGKGI